MSNLVATLREFFNALVVRSLTHNERETLVRLSRRATSAQAPARRWRIVLGCAEGKSNQQVAAELLI